jgi:hypothetical protein
MWSHKKLSTVEFEVPCTKNDNFCFSGRILHTAKHYGKAPMGKVKALALSQIGQQNNVIHII